MCENNPTSVMTIESLPTELLTHIFQPLSVTERLRAEQVCGRWREASLQTWRDIQTLYIIIPDQGEYYYRFRRCTKLHELVEREGNGLFIGSDSPKIIRCLVSRIGCSVKRLIYNYRISNNHKANLSIISHYCNNLKALRLGQIMNCEREVFSRLFEHNKELHSVECRLSKDAIEALPLRNWRSLRFMILDSLCDEKIVSLIEHSEALEEFETGEYTPPVVEALLKLRNLKSLYFTPFLRGSIGVFFDVPLLNRLKNLMVESVDLDLQLLCNMLQHCCQLKRLVIYLDDIPVMLLEAILALPMLETLVLQCSIQDDILIRLTKFKNLSLGDLDNSATNNAILQIIKNSGVLEKLAIQDTGVTPEMFKQLMREMGNRQKYLEVIVPSGIFNEVSEICTGSKIRLVRDFECFREYTD